MPAAIPLLIAGAEAMTVGATVAGTLAAVGGGSALLGGVVLAGSALSTIGLLTGSAKLQKFGGIIGLVGGVGALANGAGMLGDLFSKTSMGTGGAMGAQAIENAAAAGVADTASASEAASGLAGADAANGFGASGAAGANANAATTQGLIADNAPQLSASTSGSGPSQAIEAAAAKPPVQDLVPGTGGVKPPVTATASAITPNAAVTTPTAPGATPLTWADRAKEASGWMTKNAELTKLAGGLVGGAMSDYNKQALVQRQIAAQEEAIQRQRARLAESMRNLQSPKWAPSAAVKP